MVIYAGSVHCMFKKEARPQGLTISFLPLNAAPERFCFQQGGWVGVDVFAKTPVQFKRAARHVRRLITGGVGLLYLFKGILLRGGGLPSA